MIWPTALKRYEVDKVTQAGVTILRAVKGSNPTPAEYCAFSGGLMWSIVGEHFDNTTVCIPLVTSIHPTGAFVRARVVAVIV